MARTMKEAKAYAKAVFAMDDCPHVTCDVLKANDTVDVVRFNRNGSKRVLVKGSDIGHAIHVANSSQHAED
jgi:hypothetical protein